jgi:hypothetical protein
MPAKTSMSIIDPLCDSHFPHHASACLDEYCDQCEDEPMCALGNTADLSARVNESVVELLQ